MANDRGSLVSRRHFLGWPLWDLCLALEFSFQYSWIILMNRERKQVSYVEYVVPCFFVAPESYEPWNNKLMITESRSRLVKSNSAVSLNSAPSSNNSSVSRNGNSVSLNGAQVRLFSLSNP